MTRTRRPKQPALTLENLRAIANLLQSDIRRNTSHVRDVTVGKHTRSLRTRPPANMRFSSALLKSYRSLRSAHSLSTCDDVVTTPSDRRMATDLLRLISDILSRH